VANLEERVAHLEAQTDKHAVAVEALRGDIAGLRLELRTEVAAVRNEMATRRELAELRSEVMRRFEVVDAKFDRQLYWLTGLMISGFIAVISALIAVAYK
jgi:hypothetical protein